MKAKWVFKRLTTGISSRFRMSLGIMALGFFLVIVVVNINGASTQRRVLAVSNSFIPSYSVSIEALANFRTLVDTYRDAVLTGEPEYITIASGNKKQTLSVLEKVAANPHTTTSDRLSIRRTIYRLAAYTDKADATYPLWAIDIGKVDEIIARELTAEAAAIDSLLVIFHESMHNNLDAELGEIHSSTERTRVVSLSLFLIIVLASSFTAYAVVHRSLLKPVKQIVTTARRITDGDLDCRVPIANDDEIGELAGAINTMTAKLQDSLGDLRHQVQERQSAEQQVRKMNRELDQRVRERTHELQESLEQLKTTQTRLVQSEKMAGIGQLAAGIAHEINNPVGFITSNLSTMGEYGAGISKVISAYEDLKELIATEPAYSEQIQRVEKTLEDEDIEYILEDLDSLVTESLDGAVRVKEIVQNLKSFARLDDAGMKESDLNTAIDATLKVVWNEIKYKAEVIRDYGDLPLVVCNTGKLNQVFLNLLVNATHAITDKGTITIATRQHDNTVSIKISDTGHGIPEENLSKLFEPFFTTKDVGKGTGLGLSISHGIIEEHGGRIEVESEVGTGTTFTVVLPIVPVPVPESEPESESIFS